MFRKTQLIALLTGLLAWTSSASAQRLAINNNILFDAAGALSAGVEIPHSAKSSIELYGSLRPWKRGEQSVHKHWTVQGQYRLWPCQLMNGVFYGPYVHGGEFNLGNHELCLGLLKGLKPDRYEGWFLGAGIGAGYEYPLSKHWNAGAEIGVGYTYIDYKRFNCEVCGKLKADDVYHYVGVSRLGLSLIYLF